MDDDGATETGFQSVLLPGELLVVEFVLGKDLLPELLFGGVLLFVGVSLLLSGTLSLVLKVESDGLLEI